MDEEEMIKQNKMELEKKLLEEEEMIKKNKMEFEKYSCE